MIYVYGFSVRLQIHVFGLHFLNTNPLLWAFLQVTSWPYIQQVYLVIYWLAMANSMFNPLIYYWMNARYDHSKHGITIALKKIHKSQGNTAKCAYSNTRNTITYTPHLYLGAVAMRHRSVCITLWLIPINVFDHRSKCFQA